jgi:hypothetical protein
LGIYIHLEGLHKARNEKTLENNCPICYNMNSLTKQKRGKGATANEKEEKSKVDKAAAFGCKGTALASVLSVQQMEIPY